MNARLENGVDGGTNERVLKLVVPGEKARNVKNKTQLSFDLWHAFDNPDFAGADVEFTKTGGAVRVWPTGQQFLDPPAPPVVPQLVRASRRPADPPGDFRNPYNFVPTPPRPSAGELADRDAATLDRFAPDLWSGWIDIKITTVTPLLTPDGARPLVNANDHKTYDTRTRPGTDSPLLAATSVKGMLRSAYETITHSRYGVFEHPDPLAYRRPAKGSDVVPARVVCVDGALKLDLLPGAEKIGDDGKPIGTPSRTYAAWLPAYGATKLASQFIHGQAVEAWIHRYRHTQRNKNGSESTFLVEQVLTAWPAGAEPPKCPDAPTKVGKLESLGKPSRAVSGWVYRSNQNSKNKHDEKVFFAVDGPIQADVTPELSRQWRTLISDYRSIHEKDLAQRRSAGQAFDAYLGSGEPGKAAWSRHVYDTDWMELSEGTLCYAQVRGGTPPKPTVEAIYPVQLSRALSPLPPIDFLDSSLRPAMNATELSPADRVFGWVSPKGKDATGAARRGHVRLTEPIGPAEDAIEHFDTPVPLGILGQPKPAQALFYIGARDDMDGAVAGDTSAYSDPKTQSLRGRKVYPHQRPTKFEPRNPSSEFRRADDKQDSQNRSITSWVKPERTFACRVWVQNLTSAELGALQWLCDLRKTVITGSVAGNRSGSAA
jgi:CRISPR-associated protein (TIGR03986 family)